MPYRIAHHLDRLAAAIGRAESLDGPADKLAALLRRVLPDGPVKDAASGTAVGHPIHPLLVAVPIGAWTAAGYLDIRGITSGNTADRDVAGRLIGLGVLAALPAQATGASDWLDTAGAERRIGMVHALANDLAVLAYAGSWWARRRGRHGWGIALAAIGGSALGVGGWLGGHLAYALGVGVDTTAFQHVSDDWTDVAAAADVRALAPDEMLTVEADSVPVVLLHDAGGRGDDIVALADRCTHRGAPLHEGEVSDGCLVCPWHGSRFALDGSVQRGPATRPQPRYQVRVVDGRVQVRGPDEPRALRLNPVHRL